MLVVALDLGLGREVLHLGPHVALQPAREALDLLLLLLVHLQHPLHQESEQDMNHVRLFLLGDEIARCIFGQAGLTRARMSSNFPAM